MSIHHLTMLFLTLCLFNLTGCSGGRTPVPAKVSGTVTLDGKPTPGLSVIFEPVNSSSRGSFGTTNKDGKYQLRYNSETMGAQTGDFVVMIKVADDSDDGNSKSKVKIPAVYNAKSTLTAKIEPGDNIINFDLKTESASSSSPVSSSKGSQ